MGRTRGVLSVPLNTVRDSGAACRAASRMRRVQCKRRKDTFFCWQCTDGVFSDLIKPTAHHSARAHPPVLSLVCFPLFPFPYLSRLVVSRCIVSIGQVMAERATVELADAFTAVCTKITAVCAFCSACTNQAVAARSANGPQP